MQGDLKGEEMQTLEGNFVFNKKCFGRNKMLTTSTT